MLTSNSNDAVPNTTRYFEQRLDHFTPLSTETWRQRYFVNDTFFDGTGPVFLCVGGEGPPLQPTVVVTGDEHCAWAVHMAAETKALIVALEHRYYGESLPTKDFSTENLRYLSTEQALEDLANFHALISEEYHLTNSSKWVSFGGSYPGMVAGWFRLKYPSLIHASISSSAPVKAQLNFQGYNDVVAASMGLEIVGGSAQCASEIQSAFATLGQMLQGDEFDQVAKLFNVCEPSSIHSWDGQAALTGGVSGIFQGLAQGNDPLCTDLGCNIESTCKIMLDSTHGSTAIERLASLNGIMWGGQCMNIDPQADVAALTNTTLEGGTERIWFWQTCTEYGFYQTCDPDSKCIFTSTPHYNTLESQTDLCKLAFGIEQSLTEARIERTNNVYGADRPASSRIFFVNGQVDPWHYLSVLFPLPQEPTWMVAGASHHSWTHPVRPGDSASLTAVREDILAEVQTWLKE